MGHWSDTIGRKPFLILAYLTACGPAVVVLLHLTMGLSLYFYYFANVSSLQHEPPLLPSPIVSEFPAFSKPA